MAEIDVLNRFGLLHYNVGTFQLSARRYAAAARCIREAEQWNVTFPGALATVAQAATQAGGEAYARGDVLEALARCREARDTAPEEEGWRALARLVARQAYNRGVIAIDRGAAAEAAEALSAAHEFDPALADFASVLPPVLREATGECFAAGRSLEGLGFVEQLRRLGAGSAEDAALLRQVGAWLRENFKPQVRDLKVGAAVLLLQHLARLEPDALAEPTLVRDIADLTDTVARHARERAVEVLEAVTGLHRHYPSAKLSWAGAAAYEAAMTEARRLHTSGQLMEAIALCVPATRYRPRGPDRQLPHVLATLLCRRVQDLLPEDRAAALELHPRVLDLLEAYRSPGIAAS